VLASWVLAALGVLLRLREYLANPSIWSDEAALGVNIINRSYLGLTHTLALYQGAPIGFLFLEKTADEVFGPQAFALRLAPFLAALVLVMVFRSLAMRTLGGWPGCVAVLLVAVSPTLVAYSTDAKQYSGDAMAVVVLAWMAVRAVEHRLSRNSLLVWAIAAAVLIWFSFPAAFAAGATSIVLLVAARRDVSALLRVVVSGALWILSFGIEYVVSLRSLHGNGVLLQFWSDALAPTQSSKLTWAYHVTDGVLHDPLGLSVLPLAAVLLAAGAVALLRTRFVIGLFCVIMVASTLFAGLVREYPVADRLVLYLVPVAALLLAGTMLLSPRAGWVALPLIAIVAASTFSSASAALVHPYVMTSGRQALQYAIAHKKPGDLVLIEGSATYLYDFYHQAAGYTVDGNVYLVAGAAGSPACSPTLETDFLQRYRKVWIVFAPPGTFEPPSALGQYQRALAAAGTTRVVESYPGNTAVILVEPHGHRDGASNLPPPSWGPGGVHGCLTFFRPWPP
jgi:hypothetical protein